MARTGLEPRTSGIPCEHSDRCATDLVYKFRKIVGRNNFSDQFRKINIRHECYATDCMLGG